MTNEEKIAELIKVSKMPHEEAIAYMKKSIAKSKMKNTTNEDNENDVGPIQIGNNPDEFYRKLGAIPLRSLRKRYTILNPMKNKNKGVTLHDETED